MKNIRTALALTATALGLASSARADFINGDFETGDFSGWTLRTGQYFGGGIGAINWNGTAGSNSVIGATPDPYSPFDSPFNGTKMARLGDLRGTSTSSSANIINGVSVAGPGTGPGNNASELSQTYVLQGLETGVYVNWATVLVEPSNVHPTNQQPLFNISVLRNGISVYSVSHTADDNSVDFTNSTGGNVAHLGGTPLWDSGQDFIGGLSAGDSIKVILTVTDCGAGGHGGMAYLDDISTQQSAPPQGVPDGGLTVTLIGAVFVGLAALRRKV
jgi:hypothetical protein